MLVRDVMTRDVACCHPSDSLADAARIMWQRDCGVAPVVDADGAVVGILTDRDICMAAWTKGLPLHAMRVAEAASSVVSVIGPDDPIGLAEVRMRAHQLRRLPVVFTSGRIAGMLSLNDLVRRLHRVPFGPHDGLSGQSIALTLASISRPRAPEAASVSIDRHQDARS